MHVQSKNIMKFFTVYIKFLKQNQANNWSFKVLIFKVHYYYVVHLPLSIVTSTYASIDYTLFNNSFLFFSRMDLESGYTIFEIAFLF